jgi:DNA-directed RNA polymerase specialized sigma24 family protein
VTAKQYLAQFGKIKMRLENTARQVEALEDMLSVASPKLSKTPRCPSPDVHRMEGVIAAKVDLERDIEADKEKLSEIAQLINALPDVLLSAILIRRYVLRMEWTDIANALHVCQSHIYRLHNKALTEIEKMRANES